MRPGRKSRFLATLGMTITLEWFILLNPTHRFTGKCPGCSRACVRPECPQISRGTNPLRLGICTFGNVFWSRTSSSLMMLLLKRMNAVSAYTSFGVSVPLWSSRHGAVDEVIHRSRIRPVAPDASDRLERGECFGVGNASDHARANLAAFTIRAVAYGALGGENRRAILCGSLPRRQAPCRQARRKCPRPEFPLWSVFCRCFGRTEPAPSRTFAPSKKIPAPRSLENRILDAPVVVHFPGLNRVEITHHLLRLLEEVHVRAPELGNFDDRRLDRTCFIRAAGLQNGFAAVPSPRDGESSVRLPRDGVVELQRPSRYVRHRWRLRPA